jgi:hypothetical protein
MCHVTEILGRIIHYFAILHLIYWGESYMETFDWSQHTQTIYNQTFFKKKFGSSAHHLSMARTHNLVRAPRIAVGGSGHPLTVALVCQVRSPT